MVSRAFLKSLSSSTGGTSENISSDLHALFTLELTILYGCGSYAMGRVAAWGSGSIIEKAAFYLLMLPGVIVHKTAHYISFLLTGNWAGASRPSPPEAPAKVSLGSVTSGKSAARLLLQLLSGSRRSF